MTSFRAYFKEKTNQKEMKESNNLFHFYESFDSHYEINKIYRNESFNITFYEFNIKDNKYRIFIEQINKNIHIGFEKQDSFITYEWYIEGIDNDLLNGEIQKLFGTIIYVVKDLYKQEYNAISVHTKEDKKFRTYLRLMQQISNKLLPDSTISHDDKSIHIYKLPRENVKSVKNMIFKYKPNKE